MMRGEYKLARQASGVFHFALVVVDVIEHMGLNQVTDQTSEERDWSSYPDWTEAACEGVFKSLNLASESRQ
jgi:hypothetical protein